MEIRKCEPNYKIHFGDGEKFTLSTDGAELKKEIERFEGEGGYEGYGHAPTLQRLTRRRYLAFMQEAHKHYELSLEHVLHKNFPTLLSMLRPAFIRRVFELHPFQSLVRGSQIHLWPLTSCSVPGRVHLLPHRPSASRVLVRVHVHGYVVRRVDRSDLRQACRRTTRRAPTRSSCTRSSRRASGTHSAASTRSSRRSSATLSATAPSTAYRHRLRACSPRPTTPSSRRACCSRAARSSRRTSSS